MPSVTIPLVGSPNRRGFDTDGATKDQRFIGVMWNAVKNALTGNVTVYAEKRPGVTKSATIAGASGMNGYAVFNSPSTGQRISAFVNTTTHVVTVFRGSTSAGTMTAATDGGVFSISETVINSISYYLFVCTNGTDKGGWFLADNATAQTSYTGDTHTNTTIDNIASTAGMYAGQAISGTGIAASTRIASVDSSTAITTTLATTGTATITITKTPIAKIIDTDFPASTIVGGFVEMDGYVFIMTSTGAIYHSDLNSVTSWSASAFINANMATDGGANLARAKNQIIAFGTTSSIEQFYNAGNPSGSVLGRTEQAFSHYGLLNTASLSFYSLVSTVGNLIAFLGSEMNSDYDSVYVIDGGQIKDISNPVIDRSTAYQQYEAITIDGFSFAGQNYLLLNYGNSTTLRESWLYSFATGQWGESGFPYFMRMSSTGPVNGVTYNATDGFVYLLDGSNNWQDNGAAYTMTIQTSLWDAGTEKRKLVKELALLGSDIQTSGTTTVKLLTDDYATTTTLGTFDNTVANPRITRCGSFVGGASFQLTHSANTGWRARALRIEYEVAL